MWDGSQTGGGVTRTRSAQIEFRFCECVQTLKKCLLLSSMKVTSGSCFGAAAAALLAARPFDKKQRRPTRAEGDVAHREKHVRSI